MECRHVSYHYPRQKSGLTALSGELPTGKITTIIGPNGAGKSTLLQLLARQLLPQSGEIRLADQPLTHWTTKQLAQRVAMVTQHHQLYDELTVQEVVAMGRLPYHSLWQTVPFHEVRPYLAQTGLLALADQFMQDLSGGQQQRAWLAAALAQQPAVLLLDEPTTYLDVHYQQALMTQLQSLAAKGMTVVQVLHDINQAFQVSDWLWLLNDGRLAASGTPAELRDPQLLERVFNTTVEVVTVPRFGPYIVQLPN